MGEGGMGGGGGGGGEGGMGGGGYGGRENGSWVGEGGGRGRVTASILHLSIDMMPKQYSKYVFSVDVYLCIHQTIT